MLTATPPKSFGPLIDSAAFAIASESALTNWPVGPHRIPTGQAVSARIRFVGTGSANNTAECNVWLLSRDTDQTAPLYLPTYLGNAAITLGSATSSVRVEGVSTAILWADTLVFTVATAVTTIKGSGQTILDHFNSDIAVSTYSPADNLVANTNLPVYGHGTILLDFKKGTTTSIGAIVELFGAG